MSGDIIKVYGELCYYKGIKRWVELNFIFFSLLRYIQLTLIINENKSYVLNNNLYFNVF